MGEVIGQVAQIVLNTARDAIKNRGDLVSAFADGLEEAAAKVRSGELRVEGALNKAKADQEALESARDSFKDG